MNTNSNITYDESFLSGLAMPDPSQQDHSGQVDSLCPSSTPFKTYHPIPVFAPQPFSPGMFDPLQLSTCDSLPDWDATVNADSALSHSAPADTNMAPYPLWMPPSSLEPTSSNPAESTLSDSSKSVSSTSSHSPASSGPSSAGPSPSLFLPSQTPSEQAVSRNGTPDLPTDKVGRSSRRPRELYHALVSYLNFQPSRKGRGQGSATYAAMLEDLHKRKNVLHNMGNPMSLKNLIETMIKWNLDDRPDDSSAINHVLKGGGAIDVFASKLDSATALYLEAKQQAADKSAKDKKDEEKAAAAGVVIRNAARQTLRTCEHTPGLTKSDSSEPVAEGKTVPKKRKQLHRSSTGEELLHRLSKIEEHVHKAEERSAGLVEDIKEEIERGNNLLEELTKSITTMPE